VIPNQSNRRSMVQW